MIGDQFFIGTVSDMRGIAPELVEKIEGGYLMTHAARPCKFTGSSGVWNPINNGNRRFFIIEEPEPRFPIRIMPVIGTVAERAAKLAQAQMQERFKQAMASRQKVARR